MAWSPDGTQVASGSGDTTVRIWRVRGWYARADPGGTHGGLERGVVAGRDAGGLGVGCDAAHLARVADGALVRTLEGHTSAGLECGVVAGRGAGGLGVVMTTRYASGASRTAGSCGPWRDTRIGSLAWRGRRTGRSSPRGRMIARYASGASRTAGSSDPGGAQVARLELSLVTGRGAGGLGVI